MQIVDERSLLAAYQPGNTNVSRQLVQIYQAEVVRTCYLLTGETNAALSYARATFLRFFEELPRGEADRDGRIWILQIVGRLLLEGNPIQDDEPDQRPGFPIAAQQPQHFQVDTERSHLREALARLDPVDRTSLVLRDFNGFEEELVCQVIKEPPFDLRRRVHPARRALRSAASVDEHYSTRTLLNDVATGAPRPNLWSQLQVPLEELFARQAERQQRLTMIAAGGVALLLLLGLLWLFGTLPFSGGDNDAESRAGAISSPTTALTTPTSVPTSTATPTVLPNLSSFAIPTGQVDDQLLMAVRSQTATNGVFAWETFKYDLEANSAQSIGIQAYFPTISPDGRWLISPQWLDPEGSAFKLVAVQSDGNATWEKDDLGRILAIAVTTDRIYLTIQDDSYLLLALDLETGQEVASWPDLFKNLRVTAPAVQGFVTLIPAPDGTRLYVAFEEYSDTGSWNRTLASYTLPDMTLESTNMQTDSASEGEFPIRLSFQDAIPTPDGAFLVNIVGDKALFRSSKLSDSFELDLPFSPAAGSSPEDQYAVPSNSGRYLYVIASRRREVAIVDLLARRIDLVAPIDPGSFTIQPFSHNQGSVSNSISALSQDGARLYIANNWTETGQRPVGGEPVPVWAVDTSTWKVVGRFSVTNLPTRIIARAGQLLVETFRQSTDGPNGLIASTFDLSTGAQGQVSISFPTDDRSAFGTLETLADLYRDQYHRSPVVAGTLPKDVEMTSTLPRIRIKLAADSIAAGNQVDISATFLDPRSGQPLTSRNQQVRFSPDASVAFRLQPQDEGVEPLLLVANQTEPGAYRAATNLQTMGRWDIVVIVKNPEGDEWQKEYLNVLSVTPAFRATNGRSYGLSISTDPSEPAVNTAVTVRESFVDSQTGEPLSPAEDLVDGLPQTMTAQFIAPEGGFVSTILTRGEDSAFTGTQDFWESGVWSGSVQFELAGKRNDVQAGSITVIESAGS